MQQFTVPQFIDVEAKIIGPITVRQFIIMLAGVIVGAISYKLFDFALFITVIIFSLIIIGLFGFIKINGRPFHFFILNIIQTIKRHRLRVWRNDLLSVHINYEKDETAKEKEFFQPPPKRHTTSKLAELSLIVDTGGAYRGEENKDNIEIKSV